jgi:light-regulated signal transduction histidine kinase (bacteriophytochrome)
LIDHEKSLVAANKKLETEIEERRVSEEKIKLLNQQLVSNNQQLQNTIEELDRFAYVASHDLQEPLRKILVFSDKIQTKYSNIIDQEMDRNLAKIVKASERMQLLINDLLRFSRNSSNSEDFTSINLEQLITEVLNDMEVDIERNEAKVKIENLPQIWGISSQMRQLFQNLVSNSLKFRKKESTPVIHIYSEPKVLSNGQEMELGRIVIQDNGIGFDPKFSEDIFTVFKRLHSYHEFEGSGVGLSICKKIVERHKGYISASSEIGVGAKFIIDLPVASADLVNSFKLEKIKSQ